MLTDQHMCLQLWDRQRHHQLLRMPEREDDRPPFCEQTGHMFAALRVPTHRATQHLDHGISDRRDHRELQGVRHAFHERRRLLGNRCGVVRHR